MLHSSKGSVSLLAILTAVILTGCNESSPSESTVEKQISQQYARCSLMSVRDFTKINGFPQKDGTYIVSVKYSLRLQPSSKASRLAEEYLAKQADLDRRIAENKRVIDDAVMPRAKQLVADRNQKCGSRNGDNKTGSPDCEAAKQAIEDLSTEVHWKDLVKDKDELAAELSTLTQAYPNKITEAFNHDCPMVALGGVLDGYFGASRNDFRNYTKEFTTKIEGNIKLVNSDNGWVMGN